MYKLGLACGAAALLLAAAPASAITTFADFSPASNMANLFYTGTLDGTGSITSTAAPVQFSFLNPDGTSDLVTFDALMDFSAMTGSAQVVSGLAILPISAGTIAFTSASAVTYNGHTGTNLLTVSFDGGALTGALGGSTANYGASTPPYTVNFTSDFLDFSGSTTRDLALAIDAINPSVGFAFGSSRFNAGSITGNFGADISTGLPEGAVPEPASWAMMLCGFGLAGSVLRSQRRRTTEISFG
jgi:hypothetical protein